MALRRILPEQWRKILLPFILVSLLLIRTNEFVEKVPPTIPASISGQLLLIFLLSLFGGLVGVAARLNAENVQAAKEYFVFFRPTLAMMLGWYNPEVPQKALAILKGELERVEDPKETLHYLQTSAQNMINSSGTRALPVVTIAALLGLLQGIGLLEPSGFSSSTLFLAGALSATLVVTNIAHSTVLDMAIVQAVERARLENPEWRK
jgi:hypothetical protein